MNKEDYPSDSDQSDEDFCPAKNNDSDEPSEEESNGSEQESEEENKNSAKPTKSTKLGKSKRRSRQRIKPDNQTEEVEEPGKFAVKYDEEAEKKRSEALWADFLNDGNGSSKDSGSSSINKRQNNSESVLEPPKKIKVTEVYDFAGEEVKIIKEIPSNNATESIIEKTPFKHALKKGNPKLVQGPPIKRSPGGLSSVLNAIGKKNKISVLEKSKMDWDSFKKNEGLSEEIKTFNKGRDGYLERQDFLQRTDVRQFEIEKSLRQTKRSNR